MRREWGAAIEKRNTERACRVCKRLMRSVRLECAHILSREADVYPPLSYGTPGGRRDRMLWPEPYLVVPLRIVPLCGPATDLTTCHGKQHAGRLDLVPVLTLPEILQAVADASKLYGGNGFENARRRLIPYLERQAA